MVSRAEGDGRGAAGASFTDKRIEGLGKRIIGEGNRPLFSSYMDIT